MAITFRSVGVSPGADSASCVITKPAGLAVGDLMLAQVFGFRTSALGAFVDPVGWTEIRQDAGGASGVYVRMLSSWKIADAGDVAAANFTFTATNATSNRGAITAWLGHNVAAPIDAHNGRESGNVFNPWAPAITPSVADCMLLNSCMTASFITTFSGYRIADDNPGSWTEAYDLQTDLARDISLCQGYAIRPETTATGNATIDRSSDTAKGCSQIIAIAPAAAPAVEPKHTFRLHPRPGHRMEFHPNLKLG